MVNRPYVVLSCATTIDGYLDDSSDRRLILSNATDFDRVDALRAESDAILVGATTIRRDNPRLLVRSAVRRGERVARGLSASPAKVAVTTTGELDPTCRFFADDGTEKLVYCASSAVAEARARLGEVAAVRDAGDPPDLPTVLADLSARGVRRLLVEGGGQVHTQFLTGGLADELHLVVAPFFVGDSSAPRFCRDGRYPWTVDQPAQLLEVRRMDDVVLLRYALRTPCEKGGR